MNERPHRSLRSTIALVAALAVALVAGSADAGRGSRGKKGKRPRKPSGQLAPRLDDRRDAPTTPTTPAPTPLAAATSKEETSSERADSHRPRFYTPLWPGAGGTDPREFEEPGRSRRDPSESSGSIGRDHGSSSGSHRSDDWLRGPDRPGPGFGFGGGSSSFSKPKGPPLKPRAERLPGRVIKKSDDFPIAEHKVRVAVLGRGDLEAVPRGLVTKMRNFAKLVGQRKHPLVTGGGNGLPREAEKSAFEAGGTTWAVSSVKDVDDQLKAHEDIHTTSVLYTTGTGKGAGAIEREAPLVQVANIRTYWNGGPGTFGELIAGLHEPGVLAFAAGSGGVAGAAMEQILPHIGVPRHVRLVSSGDPRRLIDMSEKALGHLAAEGVDVTPKDLFSPKSNETVLGWRDRMDHTVMAFLADDAGAATAADQARTMELVDRAVVREHKGKDAVVTVPHSDNGLRVASRAARKGITPFYVSHNKGRSGYLKVMNDDGNEAPARIQVKFQGQGEGVGQFASHRDVVEDADVVYVTSANFRNLSGLAFALRRSKPIIAVLELSSTRSNQLRNILEAVNGEPLGERFVFDTDPAKLVDKAHAALAERDKPKPLFTSKFSSKDSKPGKDDKDSKGGIIITKGGGSNGPAPITRPKPKAEDEPDDTVEVD